MVQPARVPSLDDDIAFAPVTELSAWIASGALTSRRLAQIYLARIATLGPRLECFAAITPELAIAEADAADALTRAGVSLGPLHGIPYGLKDLFDTIGIVTGWGAEPYRNRIPEADAAIVRRLRTAGAVLVASNFTGHPCLHLRAGFLDLGSRSAASLGAGKLTTGDVDTSGRTFRVPQGISLWGRLFQEGPMLNLGMALERELGVAAERPGLPS